MKLSNLERKIVDVAVKRYHRPFYRWGHFLGWLSLPVFLSQFLPALSDHSSWLVWISILLLFEWYVVVTTRVIGRLKAEVDLRSTAERELVAEQPPERDK